MFNAAVSNKEEKWNQDVKPYFMKETSNLWDRDYVEEVFGHK